MNTLCTNCIHRFDFNHDCTEHEQETTNDNGRHVVLACTGHAPVTIAERPTNRPVSLGTRKAVPA